MVMLNKGNQFTNIDKKEEYLSRFLIETSINTLKLLKWSKADIIFINKIQFIQAKKITTTMPLLTTSATLMEIMLKKELFTYSSIVYQEVLTLKNMGSFMSRAIISQ